MMPTTPGDASPFVEDLTSVLDRFRVKFALFATSSGDEVWRYGDAGLLRHGHLLTDLFGGAEECALTFSWLDGQLLPQSWGQGEDECVVSRCGAIVYGLFVDRDSDLKRDYERKCEISASVDAALISRFQQAQAPLDTKARTIEGLAGASDGDEEQPTEGRIQGDGRPRRAR